MQGSKKEPDIGVAKSTTDSDLTCQSWWSSIESSCPESTLSKNSSLKMGVPAQHYQGVKMLDFSFQDQDSCSTQSTGQSYSRTASFGENDRSIQSMSFTQSGYNVTHGKHAARENKFTSTIRTQNCILSHLPVDHNQSFPQLAVAFPDQHFSSVTSTYGSQAVVMGFMPARVPLPLDVSSEPIYVNAKQYHGILRRRQHRAKLEAQNKLDRNRKPYLHESRHQHALKRARGLGGRFLNTKKLQESKPAASTTNSHYISGSASLHLAGKMLESEAHRQDNRREGTSTTSCSDVTSTSTGDDIYHPLEFRFSGYSSHMGESMQGGGGNYI